MKNGCNCDEYAMALYGESVEWQFWAESFSKITSNAPARAQRTLKWNDFDSRRMKLLKCRHLASWFDKHDTHCMCISWLVILPASGVHDEIRFFFCYVRVFEKRGEHKLNFVIFYSYIALISLCILVPLFLYHQIIVFSIRCYYFWTQL